MIVRDVWPKVSNGGASEREVRGGQGGEAPKRLLSAEGRRPET